MTFTAEDGTGLSGSNSYTEVIFGDDYATLRGLDTWMTLNPTQKERALVRATDYIDKNFQFIGSKRTSTQALQWPRWEAYDPDGWTLSGIPVALQQATIEYAVRSAIQELQPDPSTNSVGGWIQEVEERVGTLLERTKYADGAISRTMTPYPAADALLSRLIVRGGIRLERA